MDRRINSFAGIRSLLPEPFSSIFSQIDPSVQEQIREVRFRLGQPVYLQTGWGGRFLSRHGGLTTLPDDNSLLVGQDTLADCFRAVCGYAVHTHQNELKNGFVTLKGGHRAGICGTGVYQGGELTALREISSINIRVAHQIFGAADPILRHWNRIGVHGKTFWDLCQKPAILKTLQQGFFQNVAILQSEEPVGRVRAWMGEREIADEMDRFFACRNSVRRHRTMGGVAIIPPGPAAAGVSVVD